MPSSYGFLSTFSPTQCGMASFTSALMRQLTRPGSGVTAGVVRVVDSAVTSSSPEVVGQLNSRSADSHLGAAAALNCFDVAVVQHDHGIYGGTDGDQLLAVLDEVRVPVLVVAHTVLAHPSAHQLQVMQQVAAAADALVTMTRAARDRLVDQYAIDPAKVVVIPHGAPARGPHDGGGIGRRPLILTWGLLGPGKGVEWAIDGLQQLRRMDPLPAYVIAGQTHPKVRQQQGEAYRLHLAERARAVGVARAIRFESSYLDEASLNRLVRRADVILVPNDSREPTTSAVLVEAVAAGKPVVATAFPHAVELLADGAGLLVPQCDGAAIGAAVHRVLTEPELSEDLAAGAARIAPTLLWPAVAEQYRSLAAHVASERAPVS